MKNLFVPGPAAKHAFQTVLFLLMFLPMALTANVPTDDTTCPEPVPTVANQSSSSVDFDWSSILGADGYEVRYVRESDGYTSNWSYTAATSISYTGLSAGTYEFQFRSVCGGIQGVIATTDIIMF